MLISSSVLSLATDTAISSFHPPHPLGLITPHPWNVIIQMQGTLWIVVPRVVTPDNVYLRGITILKMPRVGENNLPGEMLGGGSGRERENKRER